MSVVLALLLTGFFLLFTYYLNNKDIASPSVIIIIFFMLSQLINLVYITKWKTTFSVLYFLTLTIGYTFTIAGDLSGKIANQRKWKIKKVSRKNTITRDSQIDVIRIPLLFNCFVILFMITVAYFYYRDMIRIARLYGDLSLQTVFQAIRNVTYYVGTSGDIERGTSTFLSHALLASKAVAYIYIYIFLYNIVYCRKKFRENWINIIPAIIYLIESTFSTSRSQILYFMAGVCFILYLLWYCKNGQISQRTKSKFIRYGLITVVGFCIVFYLLGYLTKKSLSISFADNIAVYVGGSQVSLSKWLERFSETTAYFGEESLCGIRKVMLKLGLTNHYVVRHLEFETFGNYRGNVYTSFRRYISDFGYVGLPVMQFLSTFIVSFLYNWIKNKKTPNGLIIIYGYIVYSICMEAIDELFFSSVFEISNIYVFIYGFIIYKFIIKRFLKHEKIVFKG